VRKPGSKRRTKVWVHCGECHHEWVAFWLPMRLDFITRFKKVYCPMCCAMASHLTVGRRKEKK